MKGRMVKWLREEGKGRKRNEVKGIAEEGE